MKFSVVRAYGNKTIVFFKDKYPYHRFYKFFS